jgi:hypothetical protein
MSKKKKTGITYATIKKEFSFKHPFGELVTWNQGKRIRLGGLVYYDKNKNLFMEHFFGYGCPLVIPADYLYAYFDR